MPDSPALSDSLSTLQEMQTKLRQIPPSELDKMDDAQKGQRGLTLMDIETQILKVEAFQLQQVNDAFEKEEANLQAVVNNVQDELNGLNDAAQLIQVASKGVSTRGNIISTFATA